MVKKFKCKQVSLFTREWIEIALCGAIVFLFTRLPLYEGVD